MAEEFKDNSKLLSKYKEAHQSCYIIDASFFLDFAKSYSGKMKRKGHDLLDS